MSNQIRPSKSAAPRQPAPETQPVKRIWVVGALGILLFLALLVSAFSVWVILRPH